jgi:diguanylate cyclase (GGDEF)-like protein
VALFTDITAHKEHERQLEHIAHYDALTGLPNRVLLADRLQQAMLRCNRQGRALAVAFLDLDGFKGVNDAHGHDVGDELLITVGQRMKAVLREGDSLARIGGDEFVAVLVDLERPEACEPVLDRLLAAASEPVQAGHRLLRVSASIGVTIYPQDGVDADLLMRHATRRCTRPSSPAATAGTCSTWPTTRRPRATARAWSRSAMPSRWAVRAVLPAQGQHAHRADHRRRGADPLAASEARPAAAGRFPADHGEPSDQPGGG